MGRLVDKNILITGGNSGIGLAAAQVPNLVRSSKGCGTDDCGRTSATSGPSTTPSPP
jgi:hypothetical protein